MRGKPSDCWKTLPELRITPADAGKTFRQIYSYRIGQDHPRGCGENGRNLTLEYHEVGSPPRMRGKPVAKQLRHRRVGITPADAGKTQFLMLAPRRDQDHPRGCGENCPLSGAHGLTLGSPPRMRGKPELANSASAAVGITPADAGKTLKRSFRNQPFCSRAVQISFNFSNSLNVSLQSGSAR